MDNTISRWLQQNESTLIKAGISTARLDSMVLLSDELGKDKAWVLAHPEHVLQIEQLKKLGTKITQRAKHIPLAYIRGFAEFYGRRFFVNEHVLVPRPETESMIELLLRQTTNDKRQTIIDVGTGSGCLAITAKLEFPTAHVYATDIDKSCLLVAKNNAKLLGADSTFLHGNLLESVALVNQLSSIVLRQSSLVILANLPYVPEKYPINEAAKHEPKLALFSGEDGLKHYRRLFAQATALPIKPRAIVTESLLQQHDLLINIARSSGYTLKETAGLAQLFTLKQ